MKFPNHIVLDLSDSNPLENYKHWSLRGLFWEKNLFLHILSTNFTSKKLCKAQFYSFFKNKFIRITNNDLNSNLKKISDEKFKFQLKIKHKSGLSKSLSKNSNTANLKYIISSIFLNKKNLCLKKNLLWDLFDINFLRKEKIYTKLKYSRVPQYDIVSGGVAALFAGFLGFLICEKFGFELLDSGDFYILFMYIVFLSFFAKLYLKLFSVENQWSIVSLKWFYSFYTSVFTIITCKFFF